LGLGWRIRWRSGTSWCAQGIALRSGPKPYNRCASRSKPWYVDVLLLLSCPDVRFAGTEVAADSVAVGTDVLVRPGERVPLDGTVIAGHSAVDESLLTGEAAPMSKGKGDAVYGGTVNMGGSPLTVRTPLMKQHRKNTHLPCDLHRSSAV